MPRKILHLDLDAFFCSVEELLDPSLVGKAFAVGGSPQGRGVIASCSYAARLKGVRSAMPAGKAIQLCPELILIHHRHGLYGDYSDRVMSILQDTTPLVEQVSVDEAFLDVSDLPQPLRLIAFGLQKRVADETQLPCSLGGATNKLIAKMANDYGKKQVRTGRAPRAISIIEPGEEQAFLAPLDVQALWGFGPKTADKLRERGIIRIGQLYELSETELHNFFGNHASEILDRAKGIDSRPVYDSEHDPKSVSNETTYYSDTDDLEQISNTLRWLSDKVGYRLRKHNLAGSCVQIKIRYSDFTTITRQKMLQQPTNLDDEIFSAVTELLKSHLTADREVRLLGVGVTKLEQPAIQLSLWDNTVQKKTQLTEAIDTLKDKYGKDIIVRGSAMKSSKKDPNR
jgi:DNA polymerase-4